MSGDLDARAVDAYRQTCTAAGVDPEADLTEARLTGIPVWLWIVARLRHAASALRNAPLPHSAAASAIGLIAHLPDRAPQVAVELVVAHCEDDNILMVLAEGLTDPALLVTLARRSTAAAAKIAQRPRIAPEVTAGIATHAWPMIRGMVARNPSTAFEVVDQLSRDPDSMVRAAAVGTGRFAAAAEDRFLVDEGRHVRQALARVSSSPAVLRVLAGDREPWVRAIVAGNEHCPTRALRCLAREPEETVASPARATLARLRDARTGRISR